MNPEKVNNPQALIKKRAKIVKKEQQPIVKIKKKKKKKVEGNAEMSFQELKKLKNDVILASANASSVIGL